MPKVGYNRCSIFRCVLFFICMAVCNVLSATTNQYCDTQLVKNNIILSRAAIGSAAMDAGAEMDFSRHTIEVSLPVSEQDYFPDDTGINFQYTHIDFDNALKPMSNGHLHSWDFSFNWRTMGKGYTLKYYLAPVLSVSSNALKNPGLIDGDGLQLWSGLVYKNIINNKKSWLLGLTADHRFGRYQVYPLFGLCWQAGASWQLQLALPDFSIQKTFSNGINIKFYAEPDGNQWHVFSDDRSRNSDFVYEAIVTGLAIEWLISSTVKLGFNSVKHTKRKIDFFLNDGASVNSKLKSASGFNISADILF